MEYVSNSPFTESEFTKWKEEVLPDRHCLPNHLTKYFVDGKERDETAQS